MNGTRKDRHEFRFVIDGLELSDEQTEAIAREVQAAGLRSLAVVGTKVRPVAVDIGSIERALEWKGKWVLVGPRAAEFAQSFQGQFGR